MKEAAYSFKQSKGRRKAVKPSKKSPTKKAGSKVKKLAKPKKSSASPKPSTNNRKSPMTQQKRAFGTKLLVLLEKYKDNPLLEPKPEIPWESKAVFNPAALQAGGKVHLAYRAIGDGDRSALGYAASEDGFSFDVRLDEPMYVAREPFEGSAQIVKNARQGIYMSGGGGWGGCEDPRLTQIDGRVYLTYIAYDGWNPPRIALSSLSLDDFLARRWKWDSPVLISRPGVVDKNPCIFPERIRGKYVIMHRVYPDILIDYVNSLDFDGKTKWLKGKFHIKPTKNGWDSRKVGAGAPPIKTEHGWLLIYQAVGEADPGRYKIGAMLLDLEHPEKVLVRSKQPLLAPDEWYENEGWKSGVAYPCGAVVKDGRLIVYYGGADTYVCAATAKLDTLLKQLLTGGAPKLRKAARKTKRK